MPIDDDFCVRFFRRRWIADSTAVEETQDFMKGLFPVMIGKHLGMHLGAIMVSKILGKLHFRMALVIGPGISAHKSNDNDLCSFGGSVNRVVGV